MDKSRQAPNTKVVWAVAVVVVVVVLASVIPVAYKAYMTPGVRTDGIVTDNAKKASTDYNGDWHVVKAAPSNPTSVGYTFKEILPGEKRSTSGSTKSVTGDVNIQGGKITSGNIEVDMSQITTDREKRDINVRNKLLETHEYPTATFVIDENSGVDVSHLPEDGSIGTVTVPGNLTIHGVTKHVEAELDVLRTEDHMVVATTIPINRLDYNVEAPEFVAAKIDTNGELNVRVALRK